MNNIKAGDVVFYRPRGPLSWLVAKISRSDYSHVALAINDHEIVEANFFIKTRRTKLTYNHKINSVYRLVDIDDEKRVLIVANALKTLGEHYDYWQIIGLFFRFVFHWNTDLFNSMNKLICSEEIDRDFYESGVHRKDKEHLFDISPEELFTKYALYKIKVEDQAG